MWLIPILINKNEQTKKQRVYDGSNDAWHKQKPNANEQLNTVRLKYFK